MSRATGHVVGPSARTGEVIRVSVVIPCYNTDAYLGQTLGSVLEQHRPADEIIIVDDGSTDGSLAIARRFAAHAPDRVRVLSAASRRAARARNIGALAASGNALMFLDSDDVLGPDALEALVARLEADPDGIAVCPWFRLVLENGRWVKRPASCPPRAVSQDALSGWLTGWYHPPCSVLWSRTAFERAGRWDELVGPNDDGDLIMRALVQNTPLLESTQGASYYRRRPAGDTSLSGTRATAAGLEDRIRIIEKVADALEQAGRLDPYRPALAAAFSRIELDAAEHPDSRTRAGALARRYRPRGWVRMRRLARHTIYSVGPGHRRPIPAGVARGGQQLPHADAVFGEEIRDGLNSAQQILESRVPLGAPATEPPTTLERPHVTVIIPTYNRARLLARALDSVVAQTFDDFEVLVVDDGSTDDTEETVAAYADRRIRYLRQPQNAGVAAARNRGLRESRGELIAFLDSDDEWFRQKLARQVARFRDLPSHVGLLYGGVENEDGRGGRRIQTPRYRGNVYLELLVHNVIHGTSGVMIRRHVVASAGFFDEGIPAIEDYDYWVRIARFFEIDYIDEPLIRYHEPPDLERKSLNVRDNRDAREWLYRKHAWRMRQAGVAHLFLVTSARKALSAHQPDIRTARRLALRAVLAAPASRTALRMLARTLMADGRTRRRTEQPA